MASLPPLRRLFGKKPTPREVARDSKRDVQRNVRDVDREIATLRREETKLVGEIKKAAKAGNEAGTRILAKQLVRLRGQITKMQVRGGVGVGGWGRVAGGGWLWVLAAWLQ